jgi:hypothetical protein
VYRFPVLYAYPLCLCAAFGQHDPGVIHVQCDVRLLHRAVESRAQTP